MILQTIRRCIQVSVLLVLVGIAQLSLYAHYRAARVIDDEQLMAGLQGEFISQTIHPYVESLDDPQKFLDGNKGTLWSMRLSGVSITDPLAAAEMIVAARHIHWPLLASIVIPVVLTLILGRVFCSWICPAYLLFELTGKLRKLLRLAEIEPGEIRFSHRTKYLLLAAGLLLAAVVSTPLFALIYPPAVISRVIHGWVFGIGVAAGLILLGAIVVFEIAASPRWWCRAMCPGGALFGLIGWGRPVRVKLKTDLCTGCQACVPVCEAGINPITQSSSIECDNCGVCLRHCGHDALVFTIGLPDALSRGAPVARRAGTLSAAIVFGLAVLVPAAPVSAHHILGLPHYSYKENYPQRPTLEYPATTGPYDVLLTSYPGVPTPGEPANLAFYIKNRDTGKPYAQNVSVRVLQTATFGDNTIILPPTVRARLDNEFKYHVTFPADGEYIVELSMPVEGRTEVIPFLVIAGEPGMFSSTAGVAAIAAVVTFFTLLVFIVVRAVQIKRRKRLRHDGPGSSPVSADTSRGRPPANSELAEV